MYADDTNIFLYGKNINQMTTDLNEDLQSLSKYLKSNRLSLNLNKTHSILFTLNHNLRDTVLSLRIDGTIIDTVQCTNFLGVKIDHKLNFGEHISHICNKVSKSIGIIHKVSKLINRPTLLMLYNSLILPYLTYCITVWGKSANTHINRLFVLQKKAVRIICNKPPLTHTAPLFYDCSLLTLQDLYTYCTSIFIYKLNHHMLPPPVARIFPLESLVHGHSTRLRENPNQIVFSQCRTVLRQRSLHYNIPVIHNNFLQPLLHLSSLGKFKSELICILIAQYS